MASSANFDKLVTLLQELFQLDQADLDFGIYRIMNQKRDEVVRFLEKDLLPQVKESFSQYKSADKAGLQKDLEKAIEQATGLGVDPETTTKVKDLRQQLSESSVDVGTLEQEVFSHLYSFFRRYYNEGDFISQRRYKEGVYAIPYEGEEVKLHWANRDQYYVKSSEYFRDYIFTMPSGKRVRVHLVAASSEQDNKKEAVGKERRFVICNEDPIYEENGELFIRFEYRPDDGKKKQDALNQEAAKHIDKALKALIDQRKWLNPWTEELLPEGEKEDATTDFEARILALEPDASTHSFELPSTRTVRIEVAEQTEVGRHQAADMKLALVKNLPIKLDGGVLVIQFVRTAGCGKTQQILLCEALEAIKREFMTSSRLVEWQADLQKPAPTKSNPNRTVLEKHLTQYTARNTFDYFIHKDLGGFLRRELDFYIKNEVMHLDDIENDNVPRVEQYLSKIKVIRKIAHKIIQFLEQLENFQKKLWLKKKFVVETNYCITLDRVPEELYPEIAANDAQCEEWVRLFAIDEIEKNLTEPGVNGGEKPWRLAGEKCSALPVGITRWSVAGSSLRGV